MNKRISEAVLKVLREDKEARKNDFILIAEVYEELGFPTHLTLKDLAFLTALNDEANHYPAFATIIRARRKQQELHPELIDLETQKKRFKEEEQVLNYLHDEDLEFIELAQKKDTK